MAIFGYGGNAREIVGAGRLAVGVMVTAGLSCLQTTFRPTSAAMSLHTLTTAGALAMIAAFAVAAGLAIFAASVDIDGRRRRVYTRQPPR